MKKQLLADLSEKRKVFGGRAARGLKKRMKRWWAKRARKEGKE